MEKPTVRELLEAVQKFLERDLLPELEGVRRFHARVAVNVLGIVQRELALAELSSLILGTPPAGAPVLSQVTHSGKEPGP